VSLEELVNDAQPIEPNAKNAFLRVTVTVSGERDRSVTFARPRIREPTATSPP
jgi:hypothetical protein